MSDTHGRLDLMQRAADLLVAQFGVAAIVHLGDDYADAVQMETHGRKLYAVPGIFEQAWQDEHIPHRLIKDFGNVTFMLSHTPTHDSHNGHGDLNPGRARTRFGVDVLLHGHTHRRRVMESVEGLIVICPGHLRDAVDRGEPATFAVIDVADPRLLVRFYNLAGELLEEHGLTVVKPEPTESTPKPEEEDEISEETSI